MFLVFFLISGSLIAGQDTQTTDLQLHKFHPKTVHEAFSASNQATSPAGIGQAAAQQMQALQVEKALRTPAQRKIDSNVLFTVRMLAGQPVAPGISYLDTGVDLDRHDNIVVDMVAHVTGQLLHRLKAAGAQVLYVNPELRSLRAIIPPSAMEGIAASPDVIFISPKQDWSTHAPLRFDLVPGSKKRAANLRQKLAMLTSSAPGAPVTWQGSVGTEGDTTHQTLAARGAFGVNGSGLKIGVLSDGVTSRALSQATGDLPPTCGTPPCLTVLSGQAGSGDEGTAMLEIIHDMVPGASLYFATAINGITSFASNIRALRAAGCQIIVDDVFYLVESPFQDGQTSGVLSTSNGGVVTQAVNDVVADGALYFSSAGNGGNLDDGTSGTYEGDFSPQASAAPLPAGNVHNFGGGKAFDTIVSPGLQIAGLWWADPLAGSSNDYDLYVLNSTGTAILAASTNIQNGSQDPVELIGSSSVVTGNRIIVFQNPGASDRFFHLALFRGRLAVATAGGTHGHSAASAAYTVAATPAADPFATGYPTGPYPDVFSAGNLIELFSSDGLRHIFFHGDSSAITPGNFSSTGGTVLNKPDVTAADGVTVSGVGGFGSPFYGTSAAAPAAASVAALILAAQPALTASEVRTALTSTAVDIMTTAYDRDSGHGIVMALPAISSLGVEGNANPELGDITARENPGNRNGVIEAGEGASLTIQLKNTGGVRAARGVSAALTASTPGVIVTQPASSAYADMAAGAAGGNNLSPFTFTLASDYPCGQAAEFTLTVNFAGGTKSLNFTVPTGLVSITNTLGTKPPELPGITTGTGTQAGRISRNGVVSACGSSKTYPGTLSGSHTFDSYTFTACRSFCLEPQLDTLASGYKVFASAYSPSYDADDVGINYTADAGLSTNLQSFGFTTTAGTPYAIVVSDVAGNSPPNTYNIKIPVCAINCDINQLPVAVARDVSVIAANVGGTAIASIDNGSSDPDGDAITLTHTPAGPYGVGVTSVRLTVVDEHGATAQATASVTVADPGFRLARSHSSISTTAGKSATQRITFIPAPGIGAALTLACRNLPERAACSFSPPILPAGSGTTEVELTIRTTPSLAALAPPPIFHAAWLPFTSLGLIGVTLVVPVRRRRATVLVLGLLGIAALVLLMSCGGGSGQTPAAAPQPYGDTPPATYSVIVAGTSGNLTETTTFSLTVN